MLTQCLFMLQTAYITGCYLSIAKNIFIASQSLVKLVFMCKLITS